MRPVTRGSRVFSTSYQKNEDIRDIKPSSRLGLKGHSVLVTGGGRGIGFAISKAIAQEGGNVAVLDTLPEPVEEFYTLASTYGVKTTFQRADVTQQKSLESGFLKAVQEIGELRGCVPAAGVALDKPIGETSWEEARKILDVNVLGTWGCCKIFAEHVRQHGKGGSLVLIASIAAQGIKVPEQNLSIYNMSKAGVKGLVGPLAVELSSIGVRVNSISPGVIMSPMTDALRTQYPRLLKMFNEAAPVGRIGVPQDLTPQVVYLLSEASGFQTGSDVPITGGLHAGVAPGQMSKALGG